MHNLSKGNIKYKEKHHNSVKEDAILYNKGHQYV